LKFYAQTGATLLSRTGIKALRAEKIAQKRSALTRNCKASGSLLLSTENIFAVILKRDMA
jgi:hypothetical protein